jgi:hypothetical protein
VDETAQTLLLAVVFRRLAREFPDDRLVRAKSEALMGAVLLAQHPETGRLSWQMRATHEVSDYHNAIYGCGFAGRLVGAAFARLSPSP